MDHWVTTSGRSARYSASVATVRLGRCRAYSLALSRSRKALPAPRREASWAMLQIVATCSENIGDRVTRCPTGTGSVARKQHMTAIGGERRVTQVHGRIDAHELRGLQ